MSAPGVNRFDWKSLAFAATAGLVAFTVVGAYSLQKERIKQQEKRLFAFEEASTHSKSLQHLTEQALSGAALLASVIQSTEDLGRFAELSIRILNVHDELSTLQIATNNGILLSAHNPQREHLPTEPNASRPRPPAHGSLAPYGNPTLTASTNGLVASQTVHASAARGENRLWGYARAIVSIADIARASRLDELAREGFDFDLSYRRRDATAALSLQRSGAWPMADAVIQSVILPSGDSLELSLVPRGGWNADPFFYAEISLALVASALLAVLLYFLLRQPARLRSEVARTAAELAQHAAFLEQMIDAIPTPLYFKDAEGRFTNVNVAFERFYGRTRQAMIGTAAHAIAPPGTADDDREADLALLRAGGVQVYDSRVACADGVRREVAIHKAVFHDANGQVGGMVGIVLDVSERVAAERRITTLNRTFAVLSGINEAIVRIADRKGLLDRACEIFVERGQFPLAWCYTVDADTRSMHVESLKGTPASLAQEALDRFRDDRIAASVLPGYGDEPPELLVCEPGRYANSALAELAARHGLPSFAVLPLRAGGRVEGGLCIHARDADLFNAEESAVLVELADDLSFALEAIHLNARRRAAEANLRLAAQVFENSSEGIIITDAENRILAVNRTFTEVTGYARDEVIGSNPRILSSGEQGPAFYREMWHDIRKRGEWHGEVQNRRKNGEVYSEWLTISAVRDTQGETTHYVAVFSDITSSKQIEQRLHFLANYDTLTSLPNRVLFTDRLEQALAQARADGRHVAVLFLDLDRFTLINETLGHSGGDDVLREVSTRLQACVRVKDSVSRTGGDEFAIVLPDLADSDEAAPVAAKIMAALGKPLKVDGKEVYTSASIGISAFPEDGDDAETLVKNANSAMYRAMEEGHNTFCFYRQEMNARSSERMSLESDLRKALERGELAMHYQPFIDARSGRIVGAEALLRWHRPGIGFITPAAFVPLLEETGLIIPVGEWVLKTACEDNKRWREHGFSDLFVAVNFSAIQLADPGIARKVDDTLERIGFNPRYLEIELTESAVMRDAARGIRTLNEFRDIGTRLSVDDFGTGYSSLAYLKRLPIDTLKIDRSFIADTPGGPEANAIVQAIIAMGHSLHLKIIAEGTQMPEQVEFLRQMGCDLLQGFFFSTAVSQEEFIGLLRQPPDVWRQIDWSRDTARVLRSVAP